MRHHSHPRSRAEQETSLQTELSVHFAANGHWNNNRQQGNIIVMRMFWLFKLAIKILMFHGLNNKVISTQRPFIRFHGGCVQLCNSGRIQRNNHRIETWLRFPFIFHFDYRLQRRRRCTSNAPPRLQLPVEIWQLDLFCSREEKWTFFSPSAILMHWDMWGGHH